MSVKYSPEQKAAAKKLGQKLVTIDTGGLGFSGPVTHDEQRELTEFFLAFTKKRTERIRVEEESAKSA